MTENQKKRLTDFESYLRKEKENLPRFQELQLDQRRIYEICTNGLAYIILIKDNDGEKQSLTEEHPDRYRIALENSPVVMLGEDPLKFIERYKVWYREQKMPALEAIGRG